MSHCRSVAQKALDIAAACHLPLDTADIEGAAMLHDIGIFRTDAPGIECRGTEPYICHGIIGGELLRAEGAPEQWARVAERHTGSGLTANEIEEQKLPLPHRDYLPETLLERLVCYADKFFSKSGSPDEKPLAAVRASLAGHGSATLQRFDALTHEFTKKL